jgi:hypothetical protein
MEKVDSDSFLFTSERQNEYYKIEAFNFADI